jgi:predicted unusual protein kinase regulating ubiquinone biosynthesis (AarF/ABC1/UbiB family)
MDLYVRLARALWVFGTIFTSYMTQLALVRLFETPGDDPVTGRAELYVPPGLVRRQSEVDERNADRLLAAILRLRGVYIKLGQVLSIMGGFLPRVYGDKLKVLQDSVPPMPYSALVERFAESFDEDPDALFAKIEHEPLAAASLGQVHEAWLEDGRHVAVKFLYPGIRAVIRTDMKVIRLALVVYEWFVPVDNISSVYEALVDLLRRETDYIHEAECMRRMGHNFRDQPDIAVPEVIDALTTRDVLTMTYMEGFKIADVDEMDRRGIPRRDVATRLTRSFYEQLFVHRFFHADPHPGNFLIAPGENGEFRLVILDFGAISEVADPMIDGMVDVLQGFFEQNDALVLRGFEGIGFVAESGNRALVERTVLTYFRKLLAVKDRTAGALMRARRDELEDLVDPEVARQELRELMRSIHYPDGWFYVERASVLAFWLVGQIDPDLDTLSVGFPYVLPLLAERTQARASA